MIYTIWDRKSTINGKDASYFLNSMPFKKCNHDIILIMNDSGQVIQIECKEILANRFNIDVNLDIDTFMAEYFAKIESKQQEV